MGLTSELFEVAIESNTDDSEPANENALWVGIGILVVLLAFAALLIRFLYRRIKSAGSRLIKRQ